MANQVRITDPRFAAAVEYYCAACQKRTSHVRMPVSPGSPVEQLECLRCHPEALDGDDSGRYPYDHFSALHVVRLSRLRDAIGAGERSREVEDAG